MADIFISYSRIDKDFVEKLHATLASSGFDVWIDWEGIPPTAEWMREIRSAIDAADSIVFILSPESVRSEVCLEEIAHAANQQKRLIPLVYREVDAGSVPEAVAALNWIFLRETDNFDEACDLLARAIETDLEWVRAHTRLHIRAIEWNEKDRDDSFVIRGRDLDEAEKWIAGAATKDPKPTALQSEYVIASRSAATKRQRIALGSVTTGLVVAVALALLAFYQYQISEERRQVAVSRLLAAQSLRAMDEDLDLALLLSAEAARHFEGAESRDALLTALQRSSRILAFLHGHHEVVRSIAFSSGGELLASASSDGEGGDGALMLWDSISREPIASLQGGHQGGVLAVAFSPNHDLLASGGFDQQLILWETVNWRQVGEPLIGHEAPIELVAFGHDGNVMVSVGWNGRVMLWDVASPEQIDSQSNGSVLGFGAFAIRPDARAVALGELGGPIKLWYVDDKNQYKLAVTFKGPQSSIDSLAFDQNGELLASGGSDHTVVIWHLETGEQVDSPLSGRGNEIQSVAFSPDGKQVASASTDKVVSFWDVSTGKPALPALVGHAADVMSLAFSPDGKMLASGSADNKIILWDLAGIYALGSRFDTHSRQDAGSLALSSDGAILASRSADNTILLWDNATNKPSNPPIEGHEGIPEYAAFSRDGAIMASSVGGREIRLWNLTTRKTLDTLLLNQGDEVTKIAFGPRGRTLASASCSASGDTFFCEKPEVRLWGLGVDEPLRHVLRGHIDRIESLAFSPDGSILATGSWDDTVILWDVTSGNPLGAPLRGHQDNVMGLAFSPDGKVLASSSHASDRGPNIIFWDIATRQQLGLPLQGHTGGNRLTVAFSPDGRTLASAREHGSVILWDVENRRQIGLPLKSDSEGTAHIAFSSDGESLIAASVSKSVTVWDVGTDSWLRRACRIANRNLSQDEWRHYMGDVPYEKTCPNIQ